MSSKSKVGAVLLIIGLFLLFDAASVLALPGGSGNLVVSTVAQGGTAVSGEIYIDGTPTSQGFANVSISAGPHSVSFGAVTGYTAPVPVPVTVQDRKAAQVQGVYVPSTSTTTTCPPGYYLSNGLCVQYQTTTTPGGQTTTTSTGQGNQTWSPPQMSVATDSTALEPTQAATITAVISQNGQPLSGVSVYWTGAGNGVYASFSVSMSKTDGSGVATTRFTQTTAVPSPQTVILVASATYGNTTMGGQVTIYLGAIQQSPITITTAQSGVGSTTGVSPIPVIYVDSVQVHTGFGTFTVQVTAETSHTVSWGDLTGFTTPASYSLWANPGTTYPVTGTYIGTTVPPPPPSTVTLHILCVAQLPSGGLPDPVYSTPIVVTDATGKVIGQGTTDANGMVDIMLPANAGVVTVTATPPAGQFQGSNVHYTTLTVGTASLSLTLKWTEHGFSLVFGSAFDPSTEAIGGIFLAALGGIMVYSGRRKAAALKP
jgi:hypothetical protein